MSTFIEAKPEVWNEVRLLLAHGNFFAGADQLLSLHRILVNNCLQRWAVPYSNFWRSPLNVRSTTSIITSTPTSLGEVAGESDSSMSFLRRFYLLIEVGKPVLDCRLVGEQEYRVQDPPINPL